MKISERPIAITDVETTGLDPKINEIIDIGLVVVRQPDLVIVDEFSAKVKPEHIETATSEALEINDYNEIEWRGAISLERTMGIYAKKTFGAIFAAWNVEFDWSFMFNKLFIWSFIKEAFRKVNIPDSMDHHRIDLWTVAYEKLSRKGDFKNLGLGEVCEHFGIQKEPIPHRGINGAMKAYEVYKKLRQM